MLCSVNTNIAGCVLRSYREHWTIVLTRTTNVRKYQPAVATLTCVLTVRGKTLRLDGRMSVQRVTSSVRSQSTQMVGTGLGGVVTVKSVATGGALSIFTF